jgi:hypothetical protein
MDKTEQRLDELDRMIRRLTRRVINLERLLKKVPTLAQGEPLTLEACLGFV